MATNLVDKGIGLALGIAVFMVLTAYIILPFFNTSYNTTVTGLSNTVTQGLLLIILVGTFISYMRWSMYK